jgi:hypothetical protein
MSETQNIHTWWDALPDKDKERVMLEEMERDMDDTMMGELAGCPFCGSGPFLMGVYAALADWETKNEPNNPFTPTPANGREDFDAWDRGYSRVWDALESEQNPQPPAKP